MMIYISMRLICKRLKVSKKIRINARSIRSLFFFTRTQFGRRMENGERMKDEIIFDIKKIMTIQKTQKVIPSKIIRGEKMKREIFDTFHVKLSDIIFLLL